MSTSPCAASTCLPAAVALPRLRRATGCIGSSRRVSGFLGTSHGSLHGSSSATSPASRVRVPWHVVRLATRLVVTHFAYNVRSGASARRATHRAARRAAPRRLLCLCRASGCLGTSRGSSSTTSPTPRVRVPRHVVRLVTRLLVDYLCCAIGCLGMSCGSSSTTRRLTARLLVGRLHWLSPCIRSLRLVARLLVVPDCTGSTAPMSCIRTSRLDARLLVSRLHRLSLCAWSIRCAL
jgi:hypothetical protein